MKRTIFLVVGGGVILGIGLLVGAFFQNARNGYNYRLLEEKHYASPIGPIKWSCFTESVGFQFLDTEKTMISVGNRTIYKAQRDFQEDNPHARNIETSSNSIAWDDGDYTYHLIMNPITSDKPTDSTNSHPFGVHD